MNLFLEVKFFVVRLISAVIRFFVPIKRGLVLCESFSGLQYSCNPKCISEEILKTYANKFRVVWSFRQPKMIVGLDKSIYKVRKTSLKEIIYVNTAEFLISNVRLVDRGWGWKKRPGQKYIMTWHGSMALKRVEFDAKDYLPSLYIEKAERDSNNIDLMLSDSHWCTQFCKRAFHYDGEILETGLPRNDVFFRPNCLKINAQKVRQYYHIDDNLRILLYAPTFRSNKRIDNYLFHWNSILTALKQKFCGEFVIMIRLHPNMINVVDTTPLMTSGQCIDATLYEDMQDLLCAADVLITDYSSSMFEIALKSSPCFLYVPDKETYDRGFYFPLEELPFPKANNIDDLTQKILDFNEERYLMGLQHLFVDTFGLFQRSDSSSEVIKWMIKHSVQV